MADTRAEYLQVALSRIGIDKSSFVVELRSLTFGREPCSQVVFPSDLEDEHACVYDIYKPVAKAV